MRNWSGRTGEIGIIGALALALAMAMAGPALGAEPDIRRWSLNVGMVAGGSFSHDLPVGLQIGLPQPHDRIT